MPAYINQIFKGLGERFDSIFKMKACRGVKEGSLKMAEGNDFSKRAQLKKEWLKSRYSTG